MTGTATTPRKTKNLIAALFIMLLESDGDLVHFDCPARFEIFLSSKPLPISLQTKPLKAQNPSPPSTKCHWIPFIIKCLFACMEFRNLQPLHSQFT